MHLNNINGLQQSSLDLLESVGFSDVKSLASADCEVLHEELSKANASLAIAEKGVSHEEVMTWVKEARKLFSQDSGSEQPAVADNNDEAPIDWGCSPEVLDELESAPLALPLPARLLIENQLKVGEIPEAIVLSGHHGELAARKPDQAPKPRRPSAAPAVQRAGSPPAAVKNNDRVKILRSPRAETNKGKNPNSRWYIRGVLHSNPVNMYFAAVITLVIMVLVPLSVTSAILLMLLSEAPDQFGWVPKWALAFPVALPLVGVVYLLWAVGAGCRVCNQKLFVHRPHLKNSKAHRVPGFGYVFPLCLHIIVFRWFRCTHCGTSIRLKE